MSNCDCNQGCDQGCGCGCNHGAGVVPGPCISRNCGRPKGDTRIKTEVIPASAGTDAQGQPFEPKFGRFFNTVVQYAANDATYIYDSQGIWTKMNSTMTVDNAISILQQKLNTLEAKEQGDINQLQTNINQLTNKEADDVKELQANINSEVARATASEQSLQQKIKSANDQIAKKQETLVSGVTIKTVNGQSLLGGGDIEIVTDSNTPAIVPTTSYTADNVQLDYGDDKVELTPAVGTSGGMVSKAGIMSAFQATQLAALAQAYEAEEKGTILYEGSASVNNIELSESGLSYDHLIIVAQYMGMGSFALEQQVSEVFYPTDSIKSFQMNAVDISTGNTPTVELIQDIWSITDDGAEIELASALRATVNNETTVIPETTSHFTITKVVGFGKKSVIQ